MNLRGFAIILCALTALLSRASSSLAGCIRHFGSEVMPKAWSVDYKRFLPLQSMFASTKLLPVFKQTTPLLHATCEVHEEKWNRILSSIISLSDNYLSNCSWSLLGSKSEVDVWICDNFPSTICTTSTRWPCIKATTVLDLPPKKVLQFLLDSSKSTMLNAYSEGRQDVLKVDDNSKLIWNRIKAPFSIRRYDFSVLMHSFQVRCANFPIEMITLHSSRFRLVSHIVSCRRV